MNDVKSIVVKLKHRHEQKQIAEEYFRDFKLSHDHYLIYKFITHIMDRPLKYFPNMDELFYEIRNFKNQTYPCSIPKNY